MESNATAAPAHEPMLMQSGLPADQQRLVERKSVHLAILGVVSLVFLYLFVVYFLNIMTWSHAPDFGWGASNTLEGVTIVIVEGVAAESGLQVGDRIIGSNGVSADSLSKLTKLADRTPAGRNVYRVLRGGEELEIAVPNIPLTFSKAFQKYGPTWLFSAVFFVFGVVIFIMKPGASASWAFLLAMFFSSIYIMFTFFSRLSPAWLGHVTTLGVAFVAAPIVHFFQVFPEEKSWLRSKRMLFIGAPYVVSLVLFITMVASAPLYNDVPIIWKQLGNIYLLLALAVFLAATILTMFRAQSVIARARAKVVAIGVVLGAGVPSLSFFSLAFFGTKLLPNAYIELLFSSILPLAIGYSIVKHNLFDVDVYVKRAVGYVLMTTVMAAGYIFLGSFVRVLLIEPLFGTGNENIYPILYAVVVVFLFNPISVRVQAFVDRLFYRKEYDFKETVHRLEDALASVLDLDEIIHRMTTIVRDTLFVDLAGIVTYAGDGSIQGRVFLGDDDSGKETEIEPDLLEKERDLLTDLIRSEKKLITIYDIQENRAYRTIREECLQRFNELQATIGMPIIHNENVIGILYVGNKKSGKFFRREDIDLMQTLAANGSTSIENVNLVEQMKKEEAVRGNLARYLSPEIVERVVNDDMQVNLGGQRKTVSVMFSDIRDFTTISETWPPDQLVTILNEYMTEMVSIVFKHKGSIDKFVGDAIVAVYGSLIELDNQAECAVKAVFEMQEKLKELNVRWQDVYGVDMKIGCGINTGEVFLGNIGSPDRMEFTVIGDAVNLSARLEGLTKFYGVGLVVSEFTRAGLDGIVCRKLDRVLVKGKRKAVEIYEPVCMVADADDQLRSELDTYDEALACYYEQRWDEANAILTRLHNQYPERKIYSIYLERIETLRDAGLSADWDGVYIHTSK